MNNTCTRCDKVKHGIFITGTGTDVGKTWFSGLLVKYLREHQINAGYYKAALSGAEEIDGRLVAGDAKFVCDTAGLTVDPNQLVSYVYRTAVSPALAAEMEGNPPELSVIEHDFNQMFNMFDFLVVEGSGGIVCPIRRGDHPIVLVDIITRLALDIIIVANAGLGTLNSTVLTLQYARSHGIGVRGIVLNHFDSNDFLHQDNKQSLLQATGLPILACLPDDEQTLSDFDLSTIL
ncbi:MAG: dethiobiotin synthase [Planctomycetia bacterium]|nr:dethiobiotin synthase [Planctomycetia bacterium]